MLDLEPEIDAEYQRALTEAEALADPVGQYTLSVFDVLRAHFLIANHFYLEGEGLGGVGTKEFGLLHSAIHRQGVAFGGIVKWTNLFDVSATLFYGLIKNHAFHDANKRTAFLSALYQLHRHGWCPSVPEKEFEDFTVEIADNQLMKYARYKELVKSGDPDPEVKFISWYLRKNTRQIDKKDHVITFRDLQRILSRYGYKLANPFRNHIDIIKVETKQPVLALFGKERIVETKVGQIGFPRLTAEVGKGAIKTVREVTKLTPENGVDSASFFNGVDDMQSLITTYHQPLMSLASR
jgi:death-on-curing protein